LGSIHQHNLAALYKAATVLAYPSLWEGFGLPILEAMAQGTAVVTSQGTSTEEVAGGAAVIVDPSDVTSIVTGIREALRRVDELAVAGKERVQQMTWQHTAQMTRDVYEEVVEDATRGNVGRS
jgi:glycosyltransferase involved in cell wall biosynthesis